MLLNYLIISLRNIRKHFSYSLINIVGLGLGLATCLLLVTWIMHELSYDRFHEKSDRIYRASLEYSFGGQSSKTSVTPTAFLPVAQKNFPEIETGVRIYNPAAYNPFIVRYGDKLFQEGRFYFADSAFFDVFSFKLLEGSAKTALQRPYSVILTQRTAKKYFGDEDPVGKVIQISHGTHDYLVTGLMEDLPSNSLLQFDFLASFSSLEKSKSQAWDSANDQTFLLLSPSANVPALQDKINRLVKKELGMNDATSKDYVRYPLILMRDIYLYSDMGESETTSSIKYIYGFGGIAIIILLIACINYINLATAKAVERAKEVSIRKVVGALKQQLFAQFIGESLIITLLAFVLAFVIAIITIPIFNSITGKDFGAHLFTQPLFILFSIGAVIVIALGAGAYPAFAITGFNPATVLKGNFKTSGRGVWLRKALVIFQFSISIILIVDTIVILKQLNFIQNVRLGYDKENIIVMPLDRKSRELYGQFREQLTNSGVVEQVARATESPTKIGGGYYISLPSRGDDGGMIVTAMDVDTTFLPTMKMELVAGRNFNDADIQKLRKDTTVAFILNEAAIKELSLEAEKALGLRVKLNGRHGEIIGIVRDFHFASMHTAITPLVLFDEEEQLSFMFIRLKPGNVATAIAKIKDLARTTLSHRPFEYQFLDQKYATLYSSEQKIGSIISVFASLAIIIACLGLLGLVSFSAAQRTKEIGIRKVMGATASNIVLLITKDYAKLVLISIAIGLPIASWAMNDLFLKSYVYRTEVGWWPFLAAGAACILISIATASYQAVKAAFINPTETLRSE